MNCKLYYRAFDTSPEGSRATQSIFMKGEGNGISNRPLKIKQNLPESFSCQNTFHLQKQPHSDSSKATNYEFYILRASLSYQRSTA